MALNFCDNPYCPLDLWGPELHREKDRNVAFSMMACHQEEIDNVIERLAQEPDPNDYYAQQRVLDECHVRLEWFTDAEIAYIESEVAKRWGS